MRLKNRVAIVTGGANGIGRATVETFVREGARVVIADIDEKAGNQLAETLNSAANSVRFIKTNMADRTSVEALVSATVKAFNRLDILINNAGITADAQLVKMDDEQWDRVISVNLKGVYMAGQAAARVMIKSGNGGVILNTASIVGLYGNFGQSNYVAAKAGVIGMSKTWARELGRHNIRSNAITPGFIDTDIAKTIPEKIIEAVKAKTPLARMGEPQDIANAFLFLASDEAKFISGITLSVDGGLVI